MVPDFDVDEKVKDAFFKSGLWLWHKHPEKTKWLFTYLSGLFFTFDRNGTIGSITIHFNNGKPDKIEEHPVKRVDSHFVKNILNMAESIET